MARRLFDVGIFSVITDASAIGVGWLLNFYTANTTSRIVTYTTAAGGVANTNPVEADGDGRFPEIWVEEGQSVKWVLTDELGNIKVSVDNYTLSTSPPSIDPALNDFLAGADPLPIANGGTGQTSAVNALAALGGLPLTGGELSGELTQDSAGAYLYNSAGGQTSGGVFVTVDSDPDPTSSAGEMWLKYA